MRMNKTLPVIFLLLFPLLFFCGANIFSTQQEVDMGEAFAKEIESQVDIYDDADWNDYISELGRNIVGVCDRQEIDYHFKIVRDDSTVNAFALPGGYIYVYSGLILEAENEAELAGVLAHEVGHVVGEHSMKRMTQVYGFQMLMSLALGQNPNQLAEAAGNFIGGGYILKYSRENEYEADAFSVTYLHRLGYDPDGMKSFLQKLADMHGDTGDKDSVSGKIETLMATHPDPHDRVARVVDQIGLLEDAGTTLNEERFQKMKQRIAG